MLLLPIGQNPVQAATKGDGEGLEHYELGFNQRVKKGVPCEVPFNVGNTGKVTIKLKFRDYIPEGVEYKLYRSTPKKYVLKKSGVIYPENPTGPYSITGEGDKFEWNLPVGYDKRNKDVGYYTLELTFPEDTKFSYDIRSYHIVLGKQWYINKGAKTKLDISYRYDGKVLWKTTNKKIATINKKGVLKGKKCGDCEVIAILDTGVKLRVPLRVDAGNLSFDPDTGEFIRY